MCGCKAHYLPGGGVARTAEGRLRRPREVQRVGVSTSANEVRVDLQSPNGQQPGAPQNTKQMGRPNPNTSHLTLSVRLTDGTEETWRFLPSRTR